MTDVKQLVLLGVALLIFGNVIVAIIAAIANGNGKRLEQDEEQRTRRLHLLR